MSTDRPIIFSGPMVRALLDGRKTQTRRLASSPLAKCQVGDRLYVRETCRAEELSRPPREVPATRREREVYGRTKTVVLDELEGADGVRFLADDAWIKIQNTMQAGDAWSELYHYRGRGKKGIGNQVPSIHMPRWASRLTLTVTQVRRQPLQDIPLGDICAEGLAASIYEFKPVTAGFASWAALWDSLHPRPHAWADNPDIVALTFKVAQRNIDARAT